MTAYSVTIQLTPATLDAFDASGRTYRLFMFNVVRASSPGVPLSSLQFRVDAPTLTLSWDPYYAAFTSQQSPTTGTVVEAAHTYQLNPDQQLVLTGPGQGEVRPGTLEGSFQLNNRTAQPTTAGLALAGPRTSSEQYQPACAFTLHGNSVIAVAPTAQVLLAFATTGQVPGQVISQLFAQGTLLDLASNATATLTYDINAGWTGSNVPLQLVPGGTDLPPLLVQHNLMLSQAVEQAAD